MSALDLHCHTVRGSVDSQLTPEQLIETVRQKALTGCCISEHDNVWERHDAERLAKQAGMPVLRGMEVTTDLGHMLVYGLERYISGIRSARALRQAVSDAGGVMIAAHPFRNVLYHAPRRKLPTIESLTAWEGFDLVDEVEVLNGATAELENFLALRVAGQVGFVGVAGSDAHSVQGVGRYATLFERTVDTVEQLVAEIKARRFRAAQAAPEGSDGEIPSKGPAGGRSLSPVEGKGGGGGDWLPYNLESESPKYEARLQAAFGG